MLFIGAIGLLASYLNGKKLEYAGLTESEARSKLQEKLGAKLGNERAKDVADQVIPKLKERGIVIEDPIAEAVDRAADASRAADGEGDGS